MIKLQLGTFSMGIPGRRRIACRDSVELKKSEGFQKS